MSVSDHGKITPDGYRLVYRPSHPLANRWGTVPEHRAVLYDAIGPGNHQCHWCARPITWDNRQISFKVNADHVDGDRRNNVIENLVPACMECNTRRGVNEKFLMGLAAQLSEMPEANPAEVLNLVAEQMESGCGRRTLMAYEARGMATEIKRVWQLNKPERGREMANEDRDLEELATVGSQMLARIADNAPAAVEHVLSGMSASERAEAEEAISTGRWNNRRG